MSQQCKLPHNPVADLKFYAMVASWMRNLRWGTGLSLEEAAERMGWATASLERAEEAGLIDASQLRLVARAYFIDQDLAVGQVLRLYLASLRKAG